MTTKVEGGLNEEPFYERLRRTSKEMETSERKSLLDQRARLTFLASHDNSGECFLKKESISQLAKKDEVRASSEQKRQNMAADDKKNALKKAYKNRMRQTHKYNQKKVVEKKTTY